jgi:dihydrofolate synthase/folylpolyglutamate synthase
MTYKNALKYLNSMINYEVDRKAKYTDKNFNLQTMNELKNELDLDKINSKIFHIAGTNGKGSITTMIYTLLLNNGYKAGLFISPHVIDIRERIQADGKFISKRNFAKSIKSIKKATEKLKLEPTYFEILTLAAMVYFKKINCAYICLETGLGGRLDSTNVFNSSVSIISSISLEHTDKLGNTEEQIAYEKAGIIKPNTPVIVGNIKGNALSVILDTAKKNNAPLFKSGDDFSFNNIKINLNETKFTYIPENINLIIPFAGYKAVENYAISYFALKKLDIDIKPELRGLNLPARFCVIKKNPVIIIDGAHNKEAALALTETIKQVFEDKKICFVLGFLKDKNYKEFIEIILPFSKNIDIMKINHSSDNSMTVFKSLKDFFPDANFFQTINDLSAYINKNKNEVFIITGSFYLCSEILKNKRLF